MAILLLERLFAEYEEAELCMVGPEKDGSMQDCKRLAKRKNLNVKFTGKLKKKEWAELAKEYDFFINSTTIDNTPISVIESMGLGLPIISTNVGGMSVLIDHPKDGVLVDSGDFNAMFSEIKKIIENPDIGQKMAINARKKAESFGWKNVRKDWLEVIDNVR